MSRLMRTAATASMISNARLNKAKRQAVQNASQQMAQPAPTPVAQVAPAQPTPTQPQTPAQASTDLTTQLQQLASLHQQGILTDEEFSAKKKQLLGI